MAKIKDKITLVIQRIALDIKLLYDYINEQGLQGVTEKGNWTSNAIDFIAGNDLMFTLNNGSNGSSSPHAPPPMGGTPSLQSINKGFLFVNTSDTLTDYSNKLPNKFGMLDNNAVWANSFTFGSDFGYRFGYLSGLNGEWVSIELDTILHNTERLANATYIPAGGGYYNQKLHFPPENNATLATREWVLEGDSGTTPPTGNPTLGISFNLVYRTYRLRNNFTFDHVNKAIDAVDTKNTAGANASNSKMFLVGVLSQTTGENGNQSYSNSKIYATNGTLTATAFNGNASSATQLNTARTINGTSFNGTANITTAQWGTARNLRVDLSKNTATSVNGSANIDNIGVKNTLPIANGGTGSTVAGTITNQRNSDTLVRAWSGKIISDYVEEKAKELINEDKRVVNAIGSYGANNDHGATIILSTSTNGIGFGSASALRDTFEVSLYNNSNGSKDIWGGTGFTYQLQDGTTSSSIKIKARGIGTITRITKGSTAIMLALGDFEI